MKKYLAMAAVLAAAGSAHAAVIMQTKTFGPSTPNFSETLTFDKFDPALGTLISVEVKLALGIQNGSATVDNDGVDPASVDVDFGASGSIESTDVPLLNAAFQPVTGDVDVFDGASFNLSSNDSDPMGQFNDDNGPDNGTLDVTPQSDSASGFIADSLEAQYIGGGMTFDVDVIVDTLFNIGGEGGVAGSFVPVDADGNVMVIYNYIPVPAPGAVAIFGAAGLVGARRRR